MVQVIHTQRQRAVICTLSDGAVRVQIFIFFFFFFLTAALAFNFTKLTARKGFRHFKAFHLKSGWALGRHSHVALQNCHIGSQYH